MIDLQKLGCVDPSHIGPLAIRIIDTIQDYPHEEQGAAMALAFVLLTTKLRVHPGDLMATANNILKSNLKYAPEIRAARMYVNEHLGAKKN